MFKSRYTQARRNHVFVVLGQASNHNHDFHLFPVSVLLTYLTEYKSIYFYYKTNENIGKWNECLIIAEDIFILTK